MSIYLLLNKSSVTTINRTQSLQQSKRKRKKKFKTVVLATEEQVHLQQQRPRGFVKNRLLAEQQAVDGKSSDLFFFFPYFLTQTVGNKLAT